MKRASIRRFLQLGLLGVAVIVVSGSCAQQRDEVQQVQDAITQYAARQNVPYRNQRFRFSGVIDGAAGDGCACLKVCDSKGQNCTACVCSPANCGSCD